MEFSVLMSVYHADDAAYFRQALISILNQSVQPTQVVVVKDGSLPSQLEAELEQFSHGYQGTLTTIELTENLGLGHALNIGLSHCKYEIVARVDADDINLPLRFQTQLEFMVKNPETAVIGCWIGEFYEKEVMNVRKVPTDYEEVKRVAKYRNPLNHMTVFFRKSVVESVGSYQHFPGYEDYYLWARMLLNGYRIVNLPVVLVHARTGDKFYRRRGGFEYLKTEYLLLNTLRKIGFISAPTSYMNMVGRGIVRLMPNRMRYYTYTKILRARPHKQQT